MKKLLLIIFISIGIIGCKNNHEERITTLENQVNRLATLTNSGFEATNKNVNGIIIALDNLNKNDSIINKRIDRWSDKVVDLSQCMIKNCK
jgi:branched-subunit amino acid permease